MSRYARINASLWTSSKKWRSIVGDDRARLLYFYLHTCPQRNAVGCFVLPLAYVAADLGWTVDRVSDTLSNTLSESGLIGYDETEYVVRIVGALKNDDPRTWKQAIPLMKALLDVPDCHQKWLCFQEIRQLEAVQKALESSPPTRALFDTLSDTLSASDSPLHPQYRSTVPVTVPVTVPEQTTLVPSSKPEPPVLTYPCNGTPASWDLTRQQVDLWTKLYQGVNVEAECRKALAWVQANNRKTAKGMPRFLTAWLAKANDAPRPKAPGPTSLPVNQAYSRNPEDYR